MHHASCLICTDTEILGQKKIPRLAWTTVAWHRTNERTGVPNHGDMWRLWKELLRHFDVAYFFPGHVDIVRNVK
jgi:hypothetical protein